MADMQQRTLGRTGVDVSVVGLGTWQLGADWGEVSESDAAAVLQASFDAGVTFLDTADVYGDGRSEQVVGRFVAEHPDVTVATKMGRRVEQTPENYTAENFRAWTDRSRSNLGLDTLPLVQLHCPPDAVYDDGAVFSALDDLVADRTIAAYGVSVETVSQALRAIERHGVATVQIIVNAFRLKPVEEVLPAAVETGVGVIARVPLASGLLSGRYDASTTFAEDDHRTYNRDGSAFDVGETFSGVDFETGVAAAQEFSRLAAEHAAGATPAQAALRWLVEQPGVTTVIPGARNRAQAEANAAAAGVGPLPTAFHEGVRRLYDDRLRETIHPRW